MYCLFRDVPCIVCMYMFTVLLPPGGYPIAVNKYIISYIPEDNSTNGDRCKKNLTEMLIRISQLLLGCTMC